MNCPSGFSFLPSFQDLKFSYITASTRAFAAWTLVERVCSATRARQGSMQIADRTKQMTQLLLRYCCSCKRDAGASFELPRLRRGAGGMRGARMALQGLPQSAPRRRERPGWIAQPSYSLAPFRIGRMRATMTRDTASRPLATRVSTPQDAAPRAGDPRRRTADRAPVRRDRRQRQRPTTAVSSSGRSERAYNRLPTTRVAHKRGLTSPLGAGRAPSYALAAPGSCLQRFLVCGPAPPGRSPAPGRLHKRQALPPQRPARPCSTPAP